MKNLTKQYSRKGKNSKKKFTFQLFLLQLELCVGKLQILDLSAFLAHIMQKFLVVINNFLKSE